MFVGVSTLSLHTVARQDSFEVRFARCAPGKPKKLRTAVMKNTRHRSAPDSPPLRYGSPDGHQKKEPGDRRKVVTRRV